MGSVPCWRVGSFGWRPSFTAAVRSERCVPALSMSLPQLGSRRPLEVATRNRVQEEQRLRELRTNLVSAVLAAVPWAVPYGPTAESDRLPGIASIGFPGCAADAILMLLDSAGIDCSTGAACSAGVSQPSHVLLAMGYSEADARSALRFSLGHSSTLADVRALANALPEAVQRAKAAAAFA